MPFGAAERVLQRAAEAAENVRWTLHIEGPISAFDVARLLRVKVSLNRQIEPRGFTVADERTVWVRDGDRSTRMEHACAHELGHLHIWDNDAEPALVERACNRFAAELLLPRAEFAESVRTIGADPRALQRTWRFSSMEAIARRIAEVTPMFSSAAWLESGAKWREGSAPAQLGRRELEVVWEAYLRPRGFAEAECPAGLVRVWRTGTGPRSAVSVMQSV